MATYTVDKIEYNSNVYVLQDSGALQLTGGSVTGPVTFGDTITVDDATLGTMVVNGNASFTNNIQANTINGVTVGNSPKFTDTKVTQTEISTSSRPNAYLRLLFASEEITGTVTAGISYINWLSYNPDANELSLSGSGTISATNILGSSIVGDTLTLSSGSPNWYEGTLTATGITTNRSYNLPDKTGTIALTSDIVTHTTATATLTTTWTSNQQSVTVSGVTASNTVIVTPAPASYDAYCAAGIYCSAQAANSLTFKCEEAPSSSLTVNILIVN